MFADFFGDHRGEVALLVATLGRGDYRVVLGREEGADDLLDERCDVVGEVAHHSIVALDVG